VKFLAAITAASRIKAKLAALAAGFTAQKPPRARFCAKFAIFSRASEGNRDQKSPAGQVLCIARGGRLPADGAWRGAACPMVPACSDSRKNIKMELTSAVLLSIETKSHRS
jgi:hypothetical protein